MEKTKDEKTCCERQWDKRNNDGLWECENCGKIKEYDKKLSNNNNLKIEQKDIEYMKYMIIAIDIIIIGLSITVIAIAIKIFSNN